jgi:hypothetical protein
MIPTGFVVLADQMVQGVEQRASTKGNWGKMIPQWGNEVRGSLTLLGGAPLSGSKAG